MYVYIAEKYTCDARSCYLLIVSKGLVLDLIVCSFCNVCGCTPITIEKFQSLFQQPLSVALAVVVSVASHFKWETKSLPRSLHQLNLSSCSTNELAAKCQGVHCEQQTLLQTN